MPHPPVVARAGPRRYNSPLRPRKSVAFTLLMGIFVIYSLVPLAWLVINATKTQSDLFSSFGLWFDDDFALFQNIGDTLTYHDGIFVRWFGNTLLYVVRRRGRRDAARHARGLRAGEVPVPGPPRDLRGRARRDRGAGHGARGADVPDVQPARPDEHPVGRSSSRR